MLERQLAKTRYLSRDNITFTDIAIFPFIRQFTFVDNTWFEQAAYPNLRQWLSIFLNSTLFQTTMYKYQPWKKEQPELILFPQK